MWQRENGNRANTHPRVPLHSLSLLRTAENHNELHTHTHRRTQSRQTRPVLQYCMGGLYSAESSDMIENLHFNQDVSEKQIERKKGGKEL